MGMASRHRILPLLFWHLNRIDPEQVPKAILQRLQQHFRENTRRNLVLTQALVNIVGLLETHGVSAISLKGPLLTTSLYGNLGLRQMYDLDILVQHGNFTRAKELLISAGYRPQLEIPGVREADFVVAQRQYPLEHKDTGIVVELHWNITPRYFAFSLDLDQLWDRCGSAALADCQIRILSPEDLLLILCVHGAKHLWRRLHWLACVAELLHVHREMNLSKVFEQASTAGADRICRLGLHLVSDLFKVTLPHEVAQTLRADASLPELALEARRRLFQDSDSLPGILETTRFQLRVRDGWWDRVGYSLRRFFVPGLGDWNLLSLPWSLSFLYYLIRPLRLLCSYGPALLGRSRTRRRDMDRTVR